MNTKRECILNIKNTTTSSIVGGRRNYVQFCSFLGLQFFTWIDVWDSGANRGIRYHEGIQYDHGFYSSILGKKVICQEDF